MDSYNQSTRFPYNSNSNTMGDDADGDSEFSGILEIYVHHARNIHNICIYENQDVYAKFALTYNPDEILSTRVIMGGGKNPEFNENLMMKITQLDAVLKCEIWMLSRARNFMEDQLLGFALVPIALVTGKGKVTQDFSLSSTDLFHSPAGTVKLTLSLNTTSLPLNSCVNSMSISSEVVLLDRKISEVVLDPIEYSSIEFPDINVVKENQQMVSEYFNLTRRHGSGDSGPRHNSLVGPPASFLHLGASSYHPYCEMTMNSSENSGFFSCTTTSLSDDRNSADSNEKKTRLVSESSPNSASVCPDTPTSEKRSEVRDEKEHKFSSKEKEENHNKEENDKISCVEYGQVYSSPLGNMNAEAEQSSMQQQIVDMYMRSVHQFTESLAKMKLPMDLDKPEQEDGGQVIQNHGNQLELDKKKKDGSRVFYGSRAFF